MSKALLWPFVIVKAKIKKLLYKFRIMGCQGVVKACQHIENSTLLQKTRQKKIDIRLAIVKMFLPEGYVAGWIERPLGKPRVAFGKVDDNLQINEVSDLGGKD